MNCKLTDAQYGVKVYVYFEVNEDGEPNFSRRDDEDLREAVREGYDELYHCQGCGDEFPNFERLKDHTEQEGKE